MLIVDGYDNDKMITNNGIVVIAVIFIVVICCYLIVVSAVSVIVVIAVIVTGIVIIADVFRTQGDLSLLLKWQQQWQPKHEKTNKQNGRRLPHHLGTLSCRCCFSDIPGFALPSHLRSTGADLLQQGNGC